MPRKCWNRATREDKAILTALEQTEILFLVQNLAYDDKMIIRYANEKKGVILSNDRYRDVLETNPELEDQIKNRYSFSDHNKFLIKFPINSPNIVSYNI